jgi:hypothetical protein
MKIEKYHLKSDESLSLFEFISLGIKGPVRKIIHFQPTQTPNLFNLAFGDKISNEDEFDDLAVTNNGDTEKVLATVISALYAFFDRYPDAMVYASGSTPSRTRLYQMGITKYFHEMDQDFNLFGQKGKNFIKFEAGINYEGFLAMRKIN